MDILLVDDNLLMQQVLERFLGSLGYRVILASRADEAVERARHNVVSLILMDLHLPDQDGPEALQLLRTLPGYKHIPAIAMSGLDGPEARSLITSDFCAYVAKPIDLDALEQTVREYMLAAKARGSSVAN